MQGENFVVLKGYINRSNLKVVGDRNTFLFKGSLAVPINGNKQYVKIAAWANVAEALDAVPKKSFIHIHGHIEENSYDGKCKHCNGSDKKYWTEVLIDNFIVIE